MPYVIKCENGGKPWWIADWTGDPGRTTVIDNAQMFGNIDSAGRKIKSVVRRYPSRKLDGKLRIIYVEIVEKNSN